MTDMAPAVLRRRRGRSVGMGRPWRAETGWFGLRLLMWTTGMAGVPVDESDGFGPQRAMA